MKTKFWISFALTGKNLGVLIAEAETVEEAVKECTRRGCNPGGEAMGLIINEQILAEMPSNIRDWIINAEPYTLIDPLELPSFLEPIRLGDSEVNELETRRRATFVCKECNDVPQN